MSSSYAKLLNQTDENEPYKSKYNIGEIYPSGIFH